MEWEKSDRALRRLKQMLWGFEALRVFGDKLKKALDAVEEAGDKMKLLLDNASDTPYLRWHKIANPSRQGKEIRHKDMVSGVESVKEEYEKRCSRLQHAYNSLEQRVDQGIKLREGVCPQKPTPSPSLPQDRVSVDQTLTSHADLLRPRR